MRARPFPEQGQGRLPYIPCAHEVFTRLADRAMIRAEACSTNEKTDAMARPGPDALELESCNCLLLAALPHCMPECKALQFKHICVALCVFGSMLVRVRLARNTILSLLAAAMTDFLECLGGMPGAIVGYLLAAMAKASVQQRIAHACASSRAVNHASVMQLVAELKEDVTRRRA